uniref:HAT C-terminal dimerisation domain-containing protein n=1 Tax=Ditylenchus dipsaci TaxID=166011 RepID=A0A915CYF0_9BILA
MRASIVSEHSHVPLKEYALGQATASEQIRKLRSDDHPKTKKSKIQDALTDVLAIPAYPINTLLHPLVRKFCSVMNPKVDLPRSFNTLKALLLSKCSTVQKATKKALEGICSKPSITCDCWTDKSMKHSYLGATLHCIDKNITLRRFFGLKELEGSHTRFLLRRKTEELLAEHGLKKECLQDYHRLW